VVDCQKINGIATNIGMYYYTIEFSAFSTIELFSLLYVLSNDNRSSCIVFFHSKKAMTMRRLRCFATCQHVTRFVPTQFSCFALVLAGRFLHVAF
jgi:hypothetical protein